MSFLGTLFLCPINVSTPDAVDNLPLNYDHDTLIRSKKIYAIEMAENTANHNDRLSELPQELRDMIWEYVFEDSRLWVGYYGSRGRDSRVIRRFVSDEEPTGEYHPHPLFFLNRLIGGDIRRVWRRYPMSRLHLDSRLDYFPAQIFNNITHLSLTLPQAARELQVTVPHIPLDYRRYLPPATELVLAHWPTISHLEIHWDIDLFFFDITDTTRFDPGILSTHGLNDISTALVRLRYFRRPFQVTIHIRATNNQRLLATGTIEHDATVPFKDDDFIPQALTFQYHGQMALNFRFQHEFGQKLREFCWSWSHNLSRPRSPLYLATVEAHSHYDFAPLGWDLNNRPLPTPSLFGSSSTGLFGTLSSRIFGSPPSLFALREPDPADRTSTSRNLPPRRALPRPWDT